MNYSYKKPHPSNIHVLAFAEILKAREQLGPFRGPFLGRAGFWVKRQTVSHPNPERRVAVCRSAPRALRLCAAPLVRKSRGKRSHSSSESSDPSEVPQKRQKAGKSMGRFSQTFASDGSIFCIFSRLLKQIQEEE